MKNTTARKRVNPMPGFTPVEEHADFIPHVEEIEATEGATKPNGVLARLKGRVAKTNIINGNNRLYSKKVYEEAMKEAESRLSRGAMLGEVKHPDTTDENYDPLEKAAIKFEKLYFEDDPDDPENPFVAYEAVLINNEYGRHLKSLLDVGVHVGISTRGGVKMRSESVEGRSVNVVEKFRLRAIDAVGSPSNPFGENTAHESQSEDQEMDLSKLTPEDLEKEVPELVEKMTTAYCSKWSLMSTDNFEKMIQRIRDDYATVTVDDEHIKESLSKLELPEYAKPVYESIVKLVLGVKESVTKTVTESLKTTLDNEKEAAVKEALAPVEKKLAELSDAVEKLQAPAKAGERAKTIKDVCEKVENAPFANILRVQLERVDSATELTEALVAAKVEDSQAIWNAMGKPEGAGKVTENQKKQPSQNTKEEEKEVQESNEGDPDEDFPSAAALSEEEAHEARMSALLGE